MDNVKIGVRFTVKGLLYKNRVLKVVNYGKNDSYKYVDVKDNTFTGTIEQNRMEAVNFTDSWNKVAQQIDLKPNYKRMSVPVLISKVKQGHKEAIKEFIIRFKKMPNI